MKKAVILIALATLLAYVALYFALTTVTSIGLAGRKAVIRTYDKTFLGALFWPMGKLEGALRSPDEFTFRQRGVFGI